MGIAAPFRHGSTAAQPVAGQFASLPTTQVV
jgi:hypothetical protein